MLIKSECISVSLSLLPLGRYNNIAIYGSYSSYGLFDIGWIPLKETRWIYQGMHDHNVQICLFILSIHAIKTLDTKLVEKKNVLIVFRSADLIEFSHHLSQNSLGEIKWAQTRHLLAYILNIKLYNTQILWSRENCLSSYWNLWLLVADF